MSEYEVASQAGGASTVAQSTISRVTDANFQHQGIYNDNFYDMSKLDSNDQYIKLRRPKTR